MQAKPVLVTGGTGTLGRYVVDRLVATGRPTRVLSRRSHGPSTGAVAYVQGDLRTGDGVERAVAGSDVLVHCAGAATGDAKMTRTMLRVAERAAVRHVILISVIGADRLPLGFFRSKLEAERLVADSSLPWTTLRAAQFHDLVLRAVRMLTALPIVPVPRGIRLEPVDSREVAARLVSLALSEPAGLVSEMPGPRVYEFAELIRGYLRSRGRRRALVTIPLLGQIGRAYRDGANLSRDVTGAGTTTWEEFLTERLN